jgi:hypothetical protein
VTQIDAIDHPAISNGFPMSVGGRIDLPQLVDGGIRSERRNATAAEVAILWVRLKALWVYDRQVGG